MIPAELFTSAQTFLMPCFQPWWWILCLKRHLPFRPLIHIFAHWFNIKGCNCISLVLFCVFTKRASRRAKRVDGPPPPAATARTRCRCLQKLDWCADVDDCAMFLQKTPPPRCEVQYGVTNRLEVCACVWVCHSGVNFKRCLRYTTAL